jgi:hypothetical protein
MNSPRHWYDDRDGAERYPGFRGALRFRLALLAMAAWWGASQPSWVAAQTSFAPVIESVQPKIVKIYGAGGVQNLEHYQSGFFFCPAGPVLTVLS